MAQVELLVKIPEEEYMLIKQKMQLDLGGVPSEAEKLIANGTPLPKGHGRLIEAEKLESRMYHEAFETDSDLQKWDSGCWIRYKMFEQNIQKAETIIDADESEE